MASRDPGRGGSVTEARGAQSGEYARDAIVSSY